MTNVLINKDNVNNLNLFEGLDIINGKIEGVRELDINSKIQFFKTVLQSEFLTNPVVHANLLLFIRGISANTDLFESKDVYFSSIEEYIEIKSNLNKELSAFYTKLLTYYLGAIKAKSIRLQERCIDTPNLYFNTLLILTLDDISKLFDKINDVNIRDIKPVKSSDLILSAINNTNGIKIVLEMLNKNVKQSN